MGTASGTTNYVDFNNQALRAVSIASLTQCSRSSFMLWLGSSLVLEILCCVRFISMSKSLRVPTSGLLFPLAMSPVFSHACESSHLSVVHGKSDDNWPPWLYSLYGWELTQRNPASSWKYLCQQRVHVLLSMGNVVNCTGRAASTG